MKRLFSDLGGEASPVPRTHKRDKETGIATQYIRRQRGEGVVGEAGLPPSHLPLPADGCPLTEKPKPNIERTINLRGVDFTRERTPPHVYFERAWSAGVRLVRVREPPSLHLSVFLSRQKNKAPHFFLHHPSLSTGVFFCVL